MRAMIFAIIIIIWCIRYAVCSLFSTHVSSCPELSHTIACYFHTKKTYYYRRHYFNMLFVCESSILRMRVRYRGYIILTKALEPKTGIFFVVSRRKNTKRRLLRTFWPILGQDHTRVAHGLGNYRITIIPLFVY